MNTKLLDPIVETVLAGVSTYVHYHFKRYCTSKDQCQKVRRTMENTLTETARLFSRSAPALVLKSELRIMLQQLNEEARKLDDMTIRLPLKRLQREQRHVLRHADWLLQYLESHLADNEGEFFLFLHDVAMGGDNDVVSILRSLHNRKRCRNRRLQARSTTCP